MSDSRITDREDAALSVPRVLRVSAAVSWRVLIVLGALYVLGTMMRTLSVVVIPVAVALLLAALLAPAVLALSRWGVPRALATAVVLVGGLAGVGGVLSFVINAFIQGFPQLQRQVVASLGQIRDALINGPLALSGEQIDGYIEQAQQWLQDNQAQLTSGALSTASTFGQFLTGIVLMLFTLVFFLHDGRGIWSFVIRVVPRQSRPAIDRAGTRGFASLVGYVRATVLVAVVDALGIGLGLGLLGVPLAVPLAALVFLGAFVPIIGAVASGSVAILVALVTQGWIVALVVLGIVLLVQQLEGNVLQPLLLGRAVQLHALAVVLAISAGVVVYGIVGALLSVPLIAVLNSAVRSLVEDDPDEADPLAPSDATPHHEQQESEQVDTAESSEDREPTEQAAERGDDPRA
ncbi:AI-2E family transporter [Allosaccharopolyspora coralli]|uniref:AI-2E family transporter n=1 Tax=Allosaccharopolyspora coralli TaxID=2665642 RepID=A0A5Q3QM36_9PSEU|nr:AI-2E family transporter [Allosaccharopolyspora coralli]QGK71877.1 AI-2E family transporter [Allosaccharopolyspora coralli]